MKIKIKNSILVIILPFIVGILILINSCKKDNDSYVTDIDGNIYHTVTIGTQIWMVENLKTTKFNDGTLIPYVPDKANWPDTTPSYCWLNNNIINRDIYGALYNGFVIKTGKLCPAGWHVATDEDWTTLELYLQNNGYNYDSSIDTDNDRMTNNKTAKSIASRSYWEKSTIAGTIGNTDFSDYRNLTGFTALPSGHRDEMGKFYTYGFLGVWWSSTVSGNNGLWCRILNYDTDYILRHGLINYMGFSVRCVKD